MVQQKLQPCKTCGKDVAANARTCPHCGQSNPTVHAKHIWIGLGVIAGVIFVLFLIFKHHGPYTHLIKADRTITNEGIACHEPYEVAAYLKDNNDGRLYLLTGEDPRLASSWDSKNWRKQLKDTQNAACTTINGEKIKSVKFPNDGTYASFEYDIDPHLIKAEGLTGTWYTWAYNVE